MFCLVWFCIGKLMRLCVHAQLPPGGVRGWRACGHTPSLVAPTRGVPPAEYRKAAPPTYLLVYNRLDACHPTVGVVRGHLYRGSCACAYRLTEPLRLPAQVAAPDSSQRESPLTHARAVNAPAQVSSKRFSRFRDVESARVMPYINTRIDDEYLINVQWLMHQVKLLFPVRPLALTLSPPQPYPVEVKHCWFGAALRVKDT